MCASARGDKDLQIKLQDIIDRNGNNASIECHKGCCCTYTSKQKIGRVKKAQKRKADDEAAKYQQGFVFLKLRMVDLNNKRDYILCGEECLPMDERHRETWDRVRRCMTNERFDKDNNSLPSMKDVILDVAAQRNDEMANELVSI